MKKLLLLMAAMCFGAASTFAASVGDEITVNGVKYQIKSVTEGSESVDVAVQVDYAGASLVIPASIEYETVVYTVNSIKNMAFKGNTNITSVDIACKSINSGAFQNCSNLGTMTLREGVTLLGGNNLNGNAVTSLHLPASLTSLDVSTYYVSALHKNKLASLTIAEGNTKYELRDDGAVYTKDGKSLVGFLYDYEKPFGEVPEGVEMISQCAFEGCKNMADTLILPSTLTATESAFYLGCNVKCVILNCSGYTVINNMFQNDPDLKEIILGENCKQIGQLAFKGCDNVEKITVLGTTMPTWQYGTDSSWPSFGVYNSRNPFESATVYVHCGQKETYEADVNKWANFQNIVETLLYSVKTQSEHGTVTITDTTDCNVVTVAVSDVESGYRFASWSNGSTDISTTYKVAADTVITANFIKTFTVTVNAENGTVRAKDADANPVDLSQPIAEGTVLILTATANDGYEFDSWTNYDGTILTVTDDITVTANFVSSSTSVDEAQADKPKAEKILRDGHIFIISGNRVFNAQGAEIK